MKRRLTLPSSALLGGGKEEEDAKKRKEKVGEREEEEGLASISSNHSTGLISKNPNMDIIEKIAQGRERGELRRRLSEEGERRGRRRRRESRKGSSPSSPYSPSITCIFFDILSAGDAGGTEEGGGGSREEAKGGAGPCPPRNEVQE